MSLRCNKYLLLKGNGKLVKYFKNNIPSKVRSGGAVVGNVFSGVKNKLVGLARSVSETDIHAVTEAVL